jgi:short-subunit dehydrogenase
MSIKTKYGQLALIAGGSEGIGAAFAHYLAKEGLNLVLVARGIEKLERVASEIRKKYPVEVTCIACDLSTRNATDQIKSQLEGKKIDVLVYNAALSFIGPFEENKMVHHNQMAQANMITSMNMVQIFGSEMLQNKKGAVIIMASLAGFQGSGFLANYAATKAFNRVLAESLWYEWKDRGVDVMACCAGATSTPNFIKTKPEKTSFFAPKVQTPEAVVNECFKKLGKTPSIITGTGNKVASFIMQRLMSRKLAIKIMGDTTRQMYRL